jgi:Carboxypeptidase regulatory-like domain
MNRFASILFLVLASIPASSSSCFEVSVCTAYKDLPLIFRGSVLEVTPQPSFTDPNNPIDQVRFQVHEVFKGQPMEVITLNARSRSFMPGGEYLVYATVNPSTKEMTVNSCARNHLLASRTAETPTPTEAQDKYYDIWHGPIDSDLQVLRAYVTAHGTGTVSGTFYLSGSPLASADIVVTLSGPATRTVHAQTGFNELTYLIKDIPPGTYTIAATPPAGMTTSPTIAPAAPATTPPNLTMSIAENSCHEQNWFLRLDSHIKGRVTDPSGQPVAGADLSLFTRNTDEPDLARGRFAAQAHAKTADDGTYDFPGLDPGDYSVVLHQYTPKPADPYPPIFYPAQTLPSNATILHVEASKTIADIDLIRPAPLQPTTVHLIVHRADGTPIENAMIVVSDPASAIAIAASVKTDTSGRANVPLFVGREYFLVAHTPDPNGQVQESPQCAGPIAFIASDNATLAPLIPDKTWQACRSAPRPKLQP